MGVKIPANKELRESLGAKSAAEAIDFLNILIYGEPGVGKTYFCGTAEDHKDTNPTLLLDVEGGTVTLRRRPGVDVIPVRSMQEVVEIHKKLHESPGQYKTVIIDSLSELQKLDMALIMKEVVRAHPDRDPDVPSQREWGKNIEHVRKIVRGFRDLPCNTIMTALAHSEKDDSSSITYFPNLPGKLRIEVPGFLDIVGYYYVTLENQEIVRRLQFAKSRRVVAAKDRTGTLGEKLDNPTIPMMWQLIHDDNHKETKT